MSRLAPVTGSRSRKQSYGTPRPAASPPLGPGRGCAGEGPAIETSHGIKVLVEADHAVDLQALPPASARIAAVRCRSPLEVGGCCGQGVPTQREAAEREIQHDPGLHQGNLAAK